MGQGSWEDTSAQFLSVVQLECSAHFLESSVGCLTALCIFRVQCSLGSLWVVGFQQAREIGVSTHCGVSTGKGGSLMVA